VIVSDQNHSRPGLGSRSYSPAVLADDRSETKRLGLAPALSVAVIAALGENRVGTLNKRSHPRDHHQEIIEFAKAGEHDPEQLCDQPLASLRQPPLNV
jgi:hypothetical protein